jgi:23S rRNA pseudouridine1911/1915/1917 synthase
VTPPSRHLTADRGDAGRRLDLVIRRHLADVDSATRTRVQGWIEDGHVTVNGQHVHRPASRVTRGDVVEIALPPADAPAERPAMAAEDVALDVLYEDEHVIAIDKPAGLVVHPTYRHTEGTIMNALLWRARGWPPAGRPSIIGRLDKLTSGIVLAAKSGAVHAAFQRASADKDYLVLVYGRVNARRGEIDLRLRRDPGDRRRVVTSDTTGAASLTRFERLGRVAAPRAGLSLLRCRLMTGRMHQIRVHLAARGWPLVGDPRYGQPRWSEITDPALRAALRSFPRQALHASRLALTHPMTGAPLVIEAPLPRDFESLLTAARLVECSR